MNREAINLPRELRGIFDEGSCKIKTSMNDPTYAVADMSIHCKDPRRDHWFNMNILEDVQPDVIIAWRSVNSHITDLARAEREVPKLQQQLRLLRMEIIKLRKENTDLKQHCESLKKEAEVNLRMIDEVVARRVGECFADEGARAIEAVLRIQSGVNSSTKLREQMKLSCEDAIELFSRLGRADLVIVNKEKIELSPLGEKVANRFAESL